MTGHFLSKFFRNIRWDPDWKTCPDYIRLRGTIKINRLTKSVCDLNVWTSLV